MEGKLRPDDIYIRPAKAYKKMKEAFQSSQPVYISGITGFGKTAFVINFLSKTKYTYLSCIEEKISEEKLKDEIMVIDDIFALDDEEGKRVIASLCGKKNIWLIIINRGRVPSWMLPEYLKNPFISIGEEDLALGTGEIEKYFSYCGIRADRNTLKTLHKNTRGHPICVRLLAMHFKDAADCGPHIQSVVAKDLFDYMEQTVYPYWDKDMLDMLMRVSIVEEFTIPLAEELVESGNASYLLQRAMEVGNFISERQGVYQLREVFIDAMRKKLETSYTREQRYALYNRAGLYFEREDRIADALQMYEQSKNIERISALLMKNAEKNPASGSYYELKKYYMSLPEEYIKNEPKLIASMSMLYSIMMRPEESEKWYDVLKEYTKNHKGQQKKECKALLVYLDIGLPHRGINGIAGIFKKMAGLILTGGMVMPEFSVTSNLPSIMNGGKDFCKWSLVDKELADSIGIVVEKALRGYGEGLVNLALGESFFEKGMDIADVAYRLNRGRMQAETKGKNEMVFVAAGLLAKLSILQGEVLVAEKSMLDFKERIIEVGQQKILINIEAFLCRISLYKGDFNTAEKWLLTAPRENVEFVTMERFRYLTKVRVYIALGRLSEALSLLQRLLYYAEAYEREYIKIEGMLLMAVCYYRMGNEAWKQEFYNAIKIAESYNFVRVISMEGTAVWKLIQKADLSDINKEFLESVKKETSYMDIRYPLYLKQNKVTTLKFSENARKILLLQAEGLNYDEIAQRLGIKKDTVRYHSKETYKKLGVNGKTEAIAKAIQLKLI